MRRGAKRARSDPRVPRRSNRRLQHVPPPAGATSGVDLYAGNYLLLAVPFFILALGWEAVLLKQLIPRLPTRLRPPPCRSADVRLADVVTSLSLGILSQTVVLVALLAWFAPCYRFLLEYENRVAMVPVGPGFASYFEGTA